MTGFGWGLIHTFVPLVAAVRFPFFLIFFATRKNDAHCNVAFFLFRPCSAAMH